MEYYAAETKKELVLFATTWMELENILSEISHLVKNKYHMFSLIRECNEQNKLMSKMNQRHGNKEQTDSSQRGGERGIKVERRGR